jgi:hypothetical protein
MTTALLPPQPLDRYTTMGDMTGNVRRMLKRALLPIAVVLTSSILYLSYSGSAGTLSFGLMSAGVLIALTVWANSAIGVPLLPMIAVQQFVVCGLPILTGHEVVTAYPREFVTRAGLEVLIFSCSLAASWRMGMQLFTPGTPLAYALLGVDREGIAGLSRLGFGLVVTSTAFLVLQSLGFTGFLFQLLPAGSNSILVAIIAATSACGFFLLSMIVGSGEMSATSRTAFWVLMAANCLISASSLLLSTATIVLGAVVIGLFWSTGRLPWRFIILMAVTFSFFNTGKYAMRERYWHQDEDEAPLTSGLLDLPRFYFEWIQCGLDSFAAVPDETRGPTKARAGKHSEQGLFERLNNLQNILFVMDSVELDHVAPLDGATYTIIPPLLIPRIFWPDKPRTHEGQVLLNVHFARQVLDQTFATYVAWGLLAEAYGNFGAVKGVLLLGLFMGMIFAWAENFTTRKPLLSTEGFVAFAIFLGLANSFEMVASVMITSIFQSLVPIVVACLPFVRQKTVVRPSA